MNVVATSGRRRLVEAATGVSFDVVVDVVDANKAEQAQHALGTAAATPAAARGFSALVSDELTKKSIAVSTQATVVRAPTTESKMIKAGCYIKSHSCPNHRWASGKWNLHAHGTKMGKQYCLNDADNHHKSCGGDVMDSWSQKWVDNNGEEMVTYPKPGCYWKLEQCPKKPGWVTTQQNGGSATGWKRHSIDDQARCVGSAWSHHYFCGLSPTQLSSTVFIGDKNGLLCHSGTNREEGWLNIDLGVSQFVEHVLVYNRKDCCQNRFGKHVIETSDDDKTWTTCFRGTLPASYGPHNEACKARGRYVRLRMDGHANWVNLAEVEVYGKPSCAREGANPGSQ